MVEAAAIALMRMVIAAAIAVMPVAAGAIPDAAGKDGREQQENERKGEVFFHDAQMVARQEGANMAG